jgi:hypothetical protein
MNHGQYPYNQNNQQQYQQQHQQQQHDDYSHTHRLPDGSPQQQPLPPGWVEATDNTGSIYYCNPRTQETRWDRPENLVQVSNHLPQQYQQHQHQPQQHQQIPPLPPGWLEATDNTTGKIYYCNPKTRETKWERPSTISTTSRGPEMIENYNDNNYDNSSDYNNNNHGMPLSTVTTATTAIAMPVATGVNNDIYTSNNHNQTCNNNNNTSANVIGSNAARINNNNNNNNNREDNSNDNFDELRSMTSGQIARLCKLQQRQAKEQEEQKQQQPNKEVSTTSSNPYIPINLSSMSWLSVAERAEPGRLDVRMHSLREELNKFGYIQSS